MKHNPEIASHALPSHSKELNEQNKDREEEWSIMTRPNKKLHELSAASVNFGLRAKHITKASFKSLPLCQLQYVNNMLLWNYKL